MPQLTSAASELADRFLRGAGIRGPPSFLGRAVPCIGVGTVTAVAVVLTLLDRALLD